MLRDRSGQLGKIHFQEVAESTNFVMGSDAAEFVNKVNDQVREKDNKVERCRIRRRTFQNLVNVYGFDAECSDIHRKNFQDNQNFIMNTTDLTLMTLFDILQNWWANNMRFSMWKRFIGKTFMKTFFIDC